MNGLAKIIIFFGIILIVFGILLIVGERLPWFGKLPGDIFIKKDNFTFSFPVVTCLIVSVILSIVLSIFFRK